MNILNEMKGVQGYICTRKVLSQHLTNLEVVCQTNELPGTQLRNDRKIEQMSQNILTLGTLFTKASF